ncbi:MAG: thioredoxin domain-containing protein [Patescibacteria group bacterium]|nr:thioredoxin domain-containing protein [Patescibacteria group bacterium]
MNKKIIQSTVIVLMIVVLIWVMWYFSRPRGGSFSNLDNFAKCLTEKGAVMYGAKWCSHCQNEKKAFGDSFKHVSYVECPDEPQKCTAVGIEGYPTWIFGDGKRLEGEQGLQRLSEASGCSLQEINTLAN